MPKLYAQFKYKIYDHEPITIPNPSSKRTLKIFFKNVTKSEGSGAQNAEQEATKCRTNIRSNYHAGAPNI